jgi:putative FmdB family regulatory protein
MPIYVFKCNQCGLEVENLMSYNKMQNTEVVCTACSMEMCRLMTAPAKTAMAWHGNWSEGMDHNKFSVALGRKVTNVREEARIMESRGFASESDIGSDRIDRASSKIVERAKVQQDKTDKYEAVLKETGDKNKAVEAAFPAHECLDGTLDEIYSDKIHYTC